jgi:hypothetical protein
MSTSGLHWFNFPSLKTKKESMADIHVRKVYWFSNKTTPVIIYMLNDSISELENLKHEVDIDYLNYTGIDIYLFEPLTSYYLGDTKYNPQFYHEFLGNEDVNLIRAKELDSINSYVELNNLTNVTVRTCDYQVEKYYPHYKNFKIITDDIFLKVQGITNNIAQPPINKIEKKFISLNWRYTSQRHIMAAYLHNTNDAYITWKYKTDFETFKNNIWFDLDDWKTESPKVYESLVKGFNSLNDNAPLTLDTLESAVEISNNQAYPLIDMPPSTISFLKNGTGDISQPYSKSFVAIVNESRFAQPTGNYSEKVMQAMLHKIPFILVAPPLTLQYMKEDGFKTFSEFWDESYDNEMCHHKRLLKILELIDDINQKSMSELENIKQQLEKTVKYNFAVLLSKSHNLYSQSYHIK